MGEVVIEADDVKKVKPTPSEESVNSHILQSQLTEIVERLNQDREEDQTVIDGKFVFKSLFENCDLYISLQIVC